MGGPVHSKKKWTGPPIGALLAATFLQDREDRTAFRRMP
jgi:hypothetical protein